jgi:glyoxylase-like metal-dependent hydrolase (beta-lactamase superfamily II)
LKPTRRDFIGVMALTPFVVWNRKLTLFMPAGMKTLRGNTGLYTERGGTIGWYASDQSVIIVDAQFPESAKNFWGEMQGRKATSIDVLINTHHHGDHTAGNAYLKTYAKTIVAHKRAPELQKKRFAGTPQESQQVYANTTFEAEWSLDAGGERVNARHFGPGHTGGDAVIHFEKANVIHMGDLVFNNVYPYIDVHGGEASIPGWIGVLETVVKTYPSDALYIFGHSVDDSDVTGSSVELLRMRDYLTALAEHVRRAKADGKTADDVVKQGAIPKFERLKERWEGAFKHNIDAAFASL